MTRWIDVLPAALAATLLIAAAPAPATAPVPRETAGALAGTYTFGVDGTGARGCRLTLNGPTMHDTPEGPFAVTTMTIANCHAYPPLRRVTRWMPTGGASIRLLGGESMHTLGEFSPVQDATGLYLRGALDGDHRLFELRPVDN